MALYLFVVSTHGYGLFEAKGIDEIGRTRKAVSETVADPTRFRRLVKLTAFRSHGSVEDDSYEDTIASKGYVPRDLQLFLDVNLPRVKQGGQKSNYRLGTFPKLVPLLSRATNILCLSDRRVIEVLSTINRVFESVLKSDQMVVPTIPQMLLLHTILPRLPIKTLLRFRLACHDWESTILSPEFRASKDALATQGYLYTVPNKNHTGCVKDMSFYTINKEDQVLEEPWAKMELSFPNLSRYSRELENYRGIFHDKFLLYPTIEHVHGLILVDQDSGGTIYNPSTRERLDLPEVDGLPSKTFLLYDPVSKDYLCLHLQVRGRYFQARWIGIGENDWQLLPSAGIKCYGRLYSTQACLDGWWYFGDTHQILRFKPLTKAFEHVSIVPKTIQRPYVLFLYKGKIAISPFIMGFQDNQQCLYTLEDGQWIRMDFVLGDAAAETLRHCEKRGISDKGEIIMIPLLFSDQNSIHYFNPETGSLTTSVAVFEDTMDIDLVLDGKRSWPNQEVRDEKRWQLAPRALLHIDHVWDHLIFLKKRVREEEKIARQLKRPYGSRFEVLRR